MEANTNTEPSLKRNFEALERVDEQLFNFYCYSHYNREFHPWFGMEQNHDTEDPSQCSFCSKYKPNILELERNCLKFINKPNETDVKNFMFLEAATGIHKFVAVACVHLGTIEKVKAYQLKFYLNIGTLAWKSHQELHECAENFQHALCWKLVNSSKSDHLEKTMKLALEKVLEFKEKYPKKLCLPTNFSVPGRKQAVIENHVSSFNKWTEKATKSWNNMIFTALL